MVSNSTSRIAKNTIMLYIRMLFLMVISLYTSRVVLQSLGVEDFGLYNAVAGFITLFDTFTHSLSAAISRYLTFELGRGDKKKLNLVFSTTVAIQIAISIVFVLVAESVGIWFLQNKMTIPVGRETAALWAFQCALLVFVIKLICVPYNACIIAHEKMGAFAFIGILEGIGKLIVAFAILYFGGDRLILYSVLLCLIQLSITSIYGLYSKRRFEECIFRFVFEKSLFKEIFSFAGWNFIGGSSSVLNNHGVNVLLNVFCGPAVNAARGIAMQVDNAVLKFSDNFLTAVRPQITKSYASGDHSYMMKLVFDGSRFSAYLLILLSIPLVVETPTILSLWLTVVPDHTIAFVRLILLNSIVNVLSYTMITAMLATGNIKTYQIIVGGMNLLGFPVSWILLRLGLAPESVFLCLIGISTICLFLRLILLKRMINLPIMRFLYEVLLRVIVVALLSSVIPFIVSNYFSTGFSRLVVNSSISVLISLCVILFAGISKNERTLIVDKVYSFIKK